MTTSWYVGDDPMPVFTIKGKDKLAAHAVQAYYTLCLALDLSDQAAEVVDALDEIVAWQRRHPDLVKLPDHKHVPAGGGPWWAVDHPGIGVLVYDDEGQARIAAGTAGTILTRDTPDKPWRPA